MRTHNPEINGWKQEDFLLYLNTTLIPDLKRDGAESMAEDFEAAVAFINLASKLLEEGCGPQDY
jgi:hypothetical protein